MVDQISYSAKYFDDEYEYRWEVRDGEEIKKSHRLQRPLVCVNEEKKNNPFKHPFHIYYIYLISDWIPTHKGI